MKRDHSLERQTILKRKGFVVTESDFNIVSKVCNKSVNNVKKT